MTQETRDTVNKILLEVHKDKKDSALILISDGSTIRGGIAGTPFNIMDMLGRIIISDPNLRTMIITTVKAYLNAKMFADEIEKE